jgi:5-(carboxyamino)imidazole ribonucleotide synthase
MNLPLAAKIGIIGGGQLGKMMILEAKKMGFVVNILDSDPACPSSSICDEQVVGGLKCRDSIVKLAEISDIITYEIEHINVDALYEIQKSGTPVYPTPASLEIIQNKLAQKLKLKSEGVPVPDLMEINSTDDLLRAGEKFGYPMMVKACFGGYDGRGNYFLESADKIDEAFKALGGSENPLMVEDFVDFSIEISVLACRGINGEIAVYPVAQNAHENEVLDETRVPAAIDEAVSKQAMGVARRVMEIFEGVGMFCVEMFVAKDGVLVNEIAPRPHNSGHYSIEGTPCSQFENHIRAVAGLPLGDTPLLKPTGMKNILGEDDQSGPALVLGVEEVLAIPAATLHIYGKEEVRPKRKMGHITVINDDLDKAVSLAAKAHESLKIIGG